MKFQNRVQGDDETVTQFSQDLRVLASKSYPDFPQEALEVLTVQKFIAGLNRPLTAQRLFIKNPASLKEAVESAKLSEASFLLHRRFAKPLNSVYQVTTNDARPSGRSPPDKSRLNAVTSQFDALQVRDNTRQSTNRNALYVTEQQRGQPNRRFSHQQSQSSGGRPGRYSNMQCYNCGKFGHLRRWCRQLPASPDVTSPSSAFTPGATSALTSQVTGMTRGSFDNRRKFFRGGRKMQYSAQTPRHQDTEQARALAVLAAENEIIAQEDIDDIDTTAECMMVRVVRSASQSRASESDMNKVAVYAHVQLNDLHVNYGLIDTGSSVTLSSKVMWDACRAPNTHLEPLPPGSLITANNTKLSVLGKAMLRIRLAGVDVVYPVIVVRDLATHLLIGSDFLKRHDIDVRYSRNMLESPFGTAELRYEKCAQAQTASVLFVEADAIRDELQGQHEIAECCALPDEPDAPLVGIAHSDIVLEPNTETVVACVQQGSRITAPTLFAEPCYRTERRVGIAVANAVVTNTHSLPVRVANFARRIVIPRGTQLVRLLPVRAIQTARLPAPAAQMPGRDEAIIDKAIDDAVKAVPDSISDAHKQKLRALLNEYRDIFSAGYLDLGLAHQAQHTIDTGDARPIKQTPRRIPYHILPHVNAEVKKLLEARVVQPSTSEWSSPVVLVKKKDGTWRLCVDYRKLNAVTKKDSFPLPDIRDLFDALQGNCLFSTCDMQSGYHQLPMEASSIPKTAFALPNALYEFTRMPFGLCNGPSSFQRLVLNVFAGIIGDRCVCYIDDVITFGRDPDHHLQNLQAVFQRLRSANLKLKLSKCAFMRPSVKFLGHIISDKGLQTDPEKTDAIRKMPHPTNVTGVQQILGLLNYYRTFIHDFAEIAQPLTQLLEKDRAFEWTEACQQSFDTLKERLCTAPVLAFPDFHRQFIVDTDASGYAISGVLSQVGVDNLEHPIAYYSRTLSKCERNYSTTRRELLAVIDSIEHWKVYLTGSKFILRTDHAAILWLQNFRDPVGQNARWQARLAAFDFEIRHRPGRKHANADTLSRVCETNYVLHIPEWLETISKPDFAEEQQRDSTLSRVYQWVVSKSRPSNHEASDLTRECRYYWAKFDLLSIHEHLLCIKEFNENTQLYELKIILPPCARKDVIKSLHGQPGAGGHFSVQKTVSKIARRFFWLGLKADVAAFIRSCHVCAKRKTPRPNRAQLHPIRCGYPFERVYMDIVGPLPVTARNNRYILTMIDGYSKWAEAIPSPSQSAVVTARLIVNYWIAQHGAPTILHSDLGSNFTSRVMRNICDIFDILPTHTTAYHPAGNGAVERFNRTLTDLIATGVQDATDSWDLNLNLMLMAHRSTVTTHGYTPFYILHGFEMKVPIDLQYGLPQPLPDGDVHEVARAYHAAINEAYKHVRVNLDAAHRSQQNAYDRKARGCRYNPGDRVYVYTPVVMNGQFHKFATFWDGPATVVERVTDVDYLIRDEEHAKDRLIHFDRLKPCYSAPAI